MAKDTRWLHQWMTRFADPVKLYPEGDCQRKMTQLAFRHLANQVHLEELAEEYDSELTDDDAEEGSDESNVAEFGPTQVFRELYNGGFFDQVHGWRGVYDFRRACEGVQSVRGYDIEQVRKWDLSKVLERAWDKGLLARTLTKRGLYRYNRVGNEKAGSQKVS